MDPVDQHGQWIIDFSIFDALRAGFDKVVFIIRHDLEADFRRVIGDRLSKHIEVEYAFQEIDKLPHGFELPEGRTKPWGTSHALICARPVINEPFAVLNADDYYGKSAFATVHDYLINNEPTTDGKHNVALISFLLGNTLSDNGGVTRGVCLTDENGMLTGVKETKNIIKTGDGAAVMEDDGLRPLDINTKVSMNFWGLYPELIDEIADGFPKFLSEMNDPLKDEYLLPVSIDQMMKDGRCLVDVKESADKWFGVTYQEDKASCKQAFEELIESGVYKSPLYE